MQIASVQTRHSHFRFIAVGHLDKSKAAGLACHSIGDEIDPLDRAILRKDGRQVVLRCLETQVSYVNVSHENSCCSKLFYKQPETRKVISTKMSRRLGQFNVITRLQFFEHISVQRSSLQLWPAERQKCASSQ